MSIWKKFKKPIFKKGKQLKEASPDATFQTHSYCPNDFKYIWLNRHSCNAERRNSAPQKMKLISACTREWSLFSCKEFELRDTVVLYFFYGKCNIKKQILKSDIMIHLMSKMSLADDQQKDKLWEIKNGLNRWETDLLRYHLN